MKRLCALYAFALVMYGCASDIPETCQADPAWAEVVIWHSPKADCELACGTYTQAQYPAGSGQIEPLCVFGVGQ